MQSKSAYIEQTSMHACLKTKFPTIKNETKNERKETQNLLQTWHASFNVCSSERQKRPLLNTLALFQHPFVFGQAVVLDLVFTCPRAQSQSSRPPLSGPATSCLALSQERLP